MSGTEGGTPSPAAWDDGSADDRFRVVPAAYLFLRREGQVLLQLRAGTGFMDGHWAAGAAGHVEAGESALAAAVREAREELGVDVDPADVRPLTVQHRGIPHGPALEQRVDFFFAATRWAGTPALQEADKAADLRWFPLVRLPDPVVPHELVVLRDLHDGAVEPFRTFGF
ncbi:ADP-ribose pyrophosphatase YjhB (NUDIX family) [Isoptericola jiangsuensis]|uniref:ADP-ribose pyrophosphatase YjhB (NUDIX family) n=1 Tax=Isoptericola jiangsuensis TaxID=548579 RepID=A0A2A9EXB3_9MICO|nr:NUDIX domain-containing protein [Isoptericola jiangsuensis]PFG42865.1 ADP-ribose pyrophosphatase YjhB (NUDIX family) [Isoptericola jiangsuensis]